MCFTFFVEFWMREVNCVWFRNTVGSQFLKVSMPKDAISLQATVKTAAGIHKMTIDRWGDSTHKYDNYNSRRHPTSRDQSAIRRYEADKIVMDPLPPPIPVMKKKNSIRYWPAPTMEDIERSEARKMWHSLKHPNSRKNRRSSPYYPHSPQYPGPSTPEREIQSEAGSPPPSEMTHDPQDPWATTEDEVPHLISINNSDEEGIGQPEYTNGTPPKKLKDFIESTGELNQALEEAIQIMGEQEEETPKEPEVLKIAYLMRNLTPNKVTYMDAPDTKRANPGRHRNKEYSKAEVNQVVILEAPGSPENGRTKRGSNTSQSGKIPLIPEIPKAAEENKARKAENQEVSNPEVKTNAAGNSGSVRKRVSPCRCNKPETCTGEATSTTAGDSGHDSDNQE